MNWAGSGKFERPAWRTPDRFRTCGLRLGGHPATPWADLLLFRRALQLLDQIIGVGYTYRRCNKGEQLMKNIIVFFLSLIITTASSAIILASDTTSQYPSKIADQLILADAYPAPTPPPVAEPAPTTTPEPAPAAEPTQAPETKPTAEPTPTPAPAPTTEAAPTTEPAPTTAPAPK